MNLSKTELLRSTTRQQIDANGPETFELHSLNEKGEQIKPNKSAKILGVVFSVTVKWANHLEFGKMPSSPTARKNLEH